MTKNLLLDLIDYLVEEEIVEGDGVDIFRDFIPETPDNVIALMEYPGRTLRSGLDPVSRVVRVMVRALNVDDARDKIIELYDFFTTPDDEIHHFAESRWAVIHAFDTPAKIGVDPSNRVFYGFVISVLTHKD
jgi:hypothetical protein